MDEKLKKITFSKSLRGYACEEVDTYLRYVADKYEQRSRECTELRRQMALIAAKMNEYTEGLHRSADEESAQKKSVQETCDNMIDEAKRQAAHILAEAESEAEVIRRRAEDNAQTIAANAAREGARVVNDAARSVAARNNAADRLVEEIDSFREEVYAMYTRHIAELDRLAERTNAFYDRKTAVAEDAMEKAGNAAENSAYDAGEQTGNPTPAVAADAAAEADEDADADRIDPIRIDWKNRRAKRDLVIDIAEEDDAEPVVPAAVPDSDPDKTPAAYDKDEEDDALDALFRSLTGKNMLTPEVGTEPQQPSTPTSPQPDKIAYDFAADYEDPEESYADSYAAAYAQAEKADRADTPDTYDEPDEDPDAYDEPDEDTDAYDEPDGDPDAYDEPDGDPDAYDEPDTDPDAYDEPDEDPDAYDEPDEDTDAYDEPDGDPDAYDEPDEGADTYDEPDADPDAEDDTDWLLSTLKAQYAAKPAQDRPQSPAKRADATPENFDALLASDTATDPVQDISLTGEFDRIYNKEQAEKYMEEVEKQPLNVPEKPKNPKKHTKF